MDTDNLPVGTRIEHEKYGEGIISENNAMTYKIIFVRGGEIEFSKLNVELNVLERAETDDDQGSGAYADPGAGQVQRN